MADNPKPPYYDPHHAEQRKLLRIATEFVEGHPDIKLGQKPEIIRPDDKTMENIKFYIDGIGMRVK